MNSKETARLTPMLLLPVMVSTFIGYGLFHVSSNAAKVMGANGYIAILLATIAVVPIILISFALQRRFPGLTIIEYAPLIIGRVPALITNLAVLVFAVLYAVLIMRDAANLVSTYLLDRTPLWVILLMVFGGVVYLTYHGLESLARFSSFILIPATTVLVILILTGFINADFRNALPIMPPKLGDYFQGSLKTLYIFFPVLYLWILLAFVKEKQLRSAQTATFVAYGLIALIFFLKTLGGIAVFGSHALTRFTWATMEFVHIINLPYLILEQAGLILLIAWLAKIYAAFSVSYWATTFGASQFFRKLDRKTMVLLLAPVVLVLTLIPKDITQVLLAEEFLQQIGVFIIIPYPILLWLLAVLFRKKVTAIGAA